MYIIIEVGLPLQWPDTAGFTLNINDDKSQSREGVMCRIVFCMTVACERVMSVNVI